MIGERYDGDAGLQYLNARYYDPKLAMFIQPDWWEVTKAGVGTNRYSYSFDDPVNMSDGTGHESDSLFKQSLFHSFWNRETQPYKEPKTYKLAAKEVGRIAFDASPLGSARDIYVGVRDKNYKQAAWGLGTGALWLAGGIGGEAHAGVAVVGGKTAVELRVTGTIAQGDIAIETKVTRNFGGDSGLYGQSWTTDAVTKQSRNSLGLETSNTGEFVAHGVVVDNSGIVTREAKPWGRFSGGGQETLIPNASEKVQLLGVTMPDRPLPWQLSTDPLPLP